MSNKKKKQNSKKNDNPTLLVWIGVGIAALVLAGVLLARPGDVTGLPSEVSVSDASALRDSGAFILDVRQPEEWVEGHIPNATLIPLGELASRISELPQGQEIVVVCRSGNRSQQGRDILLEAGFEQVTSMAGGMNQWTAAGLDTVTGP